MSICLLLRNLATLEVDGDYETRLARVLGSAAYRWTSLRIVKWSRNNIEPKSPNDCGGFGLRRQGESGFFRSKRTAFMKCRHSAENLKLR